MNDEAMGCRCPLYPGHSIYAEDASRRWEQEHEDHAWQKYRGELADKMESLRQRGVSVESISQMVREILGG